MKDRHGPATVMQSKFDDVTEIIGKTEGTMKQSQENCLFWLLFDLRVMGRRCGKIFLTC